MWRAARVVWCVVCGVWCAVCGARCAVLGVQCVVLDVRRAHPLSAERSSDLVHLGPGTPKLVCVLPAVRLQCVFFYAVVKHLC